MVAVSTVHSRARGMGATASLSSLSDCLAVLLPCLAEPLSIGDARDAEWIHLATTFASVVLTSVLPPRYWPLVAVFKHPANLQRTPRSCARSARRLGLISCVRFRALTQ